jgi:hypothetical protein
MCVNTQGLMDRFDAVPQYEVYFKNCAPTNCKVH